MKYPIFGICNKKILAMYFEKMRFLASFTAQKYGDVVWV